MSQLLVSPDTSASTQEWRAWLDELLEMQPTGAVKNAISNAMKMLNCRKHPTSSGRPQNKRNVVDID